MAEKKGKWHVATVAGNTYTVQSVGFDDKEEALKVLREQNDDQEYTIIKVHGETFKREVVQKTMWKTVGAAKKATI